MREEVSSLRTRHGSELLLFVSLLLLSGICLWQNAAELFPRPASARSDAAESHYIADAGVRLNVNLADTDELTELPGIGEVLARRIVEYRSQHGPFASVDELTRVSGIGEQTLAQLRERISVGP